MGEINRLLEHEYLVTHICQICLAKYETVIVKEPRTWNWPEDFKPTICDECTIEDLKNGRDQSATT